MAGPGGREVGRIAIRVLPDTSRFSTSLQSYLDRIERRAQVKVKVAPDFSGFASEMRAELSRVRARIEVPVTPNTDAFADRVRTELSRTSARVRVPVLPDTRQFAARLRTEIRQAREEVQVPVEPDLSRFTADLRERLGRLRTGTWPIKIVPDMVGFASQLRSGLSAIRESIDVRVEPDFRGFNNRLRHQMARANANPSIPARLEIRAAEIQRIRRQLANIEPPITIPIRFREERGTIGVLRNRIQQLGSSSGSAHGSLARLSAIIAAIGLAAGNSAPAVASLVVSLAQMAPAAALLAPTILSLVTTVAALKIGAKGVGEALKNAFDPDSAEAFAEALKKLTPNAQAFVLAVQKLGPEFSKLRKAVQERLFEDLGKQITATATAALPVLRRGLEDTADSLNAMGKGVLSTARDLARSGTLGKAIDGANKGLSNLEKIPGRFLKGLTEISVAAAPAFDRITKAADRASKRISDRITRGLKTGGLERAVDNAIAKIKQLGRVGRNIGKIVGNVFGEAAKVGGDFLSLLENMTGELAKITGTKGAQETFRALFETLAFVGETAGRLLGEAFRAVAPAVRELAGPLRTVVDHLERGLTPVIRELGPILQNLAKHLGGVATELAPFLGPLGKLVSIILGGLAPILKRVGEQAVILAGHLKKLLGPAFEKLPPLLDPLARVTGRIIAAFINLQNKVLVKLGPALEGLGKAFGRVLEELTPLAVEFQKFVEELLPKLKPIIDPIIETIGELTVVFSDGLARVLEELVVPALRGLVALLKGDFDTAFTQAGVVANNMVVFVGDVLAKLPGIVGGILQRLALVLLQEITKAMRSFEGWVIRGSANVVGHFSKLPGKARSALSDLGWQVSTQARAELSELVSAVSRKISEAVERVATLPSRAAGALSGARSYLYSAGVNLVLGLIDGVLSRANAIANVARGVVERAVAAAKGALGINSPSKVFMKIGEQTGQGLVVGLDGMQRDVAKSMGSLVGVPSMRLSSMVNLSTVTAGGGDRVVEGTLLLDSGELMGKFRGVLIERDQQLLSTLRASRKG